MNGPAFTGCPTGTGRRRPALRCWPTGCGWAQESLGRSLAWAGSLAAFCSRAWASTLRSCLLIERNRKTQMTAMPNTMRNASVPGAAELMAEAASVVIGSPRSSSPGCHAVAHAGEKVVFRLFSIHHRPRQVKILGRPGRPLHVTGARKPAAIRVDLGGVREQRLVADLEEVGAVNPRGYLQRRGGGGVHPLVPALCVRRLQATLQQLLVQGRQPVLVERGEVVELGRLPRLAAVRGAGPVPGGLA